MKTYSLTRILFVWTAFVVSLFSARPAWTVLHGDGKLNYSCVFEQVSRAEGFRSGANVHELAFSVFPGEKARRQLSMKTATAHVETSDGYLKLTVNSSINPETKATATVGLEVPRAKVEIAEGKGTGERLNILLCEQNLKKSGEL